LGAQPNDLKLRILTNQKQLEEIVKNEVERKALLAEARKAGVEKRSDVAYLMRRAQDQAIVNAYLAASRAIPEGFPTDKAVDDYYAKNRERFRIPEQVNLSTIFLLLLPAWAVDKEIEKKVQAEAASLTARGRAGAADFAELARRHSQDRPTADKGGLVGWVTAEQLLPELAQAAFKMKPGEVSEPVQTPFGFQVIRVNDRTPAVQRSLSEARGEVVALLRQEYINRKEREIIENLLKQNQVSVDGAILERWRQEDLRQQRP
jgi:parvulin-like peptidyl-prolyl isomerase